METHIIEEFNPSILKGMFMPLITVYENPADFKGKFVARIWDIQKGTVLHTPFAVIKDSLEEIRSLIPYNFNRIERQKGDDPCIVEVWV
jgi:hypothetical protein